MRSVTGGLVGGFHETVTHYSFYGGADDCCRSVTHKPAQAQASGWGWGWPGLVAAGTETGNALTGYGCDPPCYANAPTYSYATGWSYPGYGYGYGTAAHGGYYAYQPGVR